MAKRKSSRRSTAKKVTKKVARKPKARKTTKAAKKTTRQTRRRRAEGRRVTAAATAAEVGVTMTVDFGSNPPGDVMTIRRIDSRALPTGRASVNSGSHTAGWDVVSPTIRPIGFSVKITEDRTGRTLLDRSQERTGSDGRGAGADRFTV